MDKMREEFDVWFNREKLGGITNESMVMVIKECMYEGWQASRQALVVELPRARSDVDYGYEPSEIIDLLELAGIKCT